jgi:hypothetical protein
LFASRISGAVKNLSGLVFLRFNFIANFLPFWDYSSPISPFPPYMFVKQTWVFWDELSLKQSEYEFYLSKVWEDTDGSGEQIKRATITNTRRKVMSKGHTFGGVSRLFGLHVARRVVASYNSLMGCLRGDVDNKHYLADCCSWVRSRHFSKIARVYLRRWLVSRMLVVNWVEIVNNFRLKNLFNYAHSNHTYDQFLGYERLRKVAFALPTGLYAFFRGFLHLNYIPVGALIPYRVCYSIFSLSSPAENSGIGMPYYYHRFIDFAHMGEGIIFDRGIAKRGVQISGNALASVKISSAHLSRLNLNCFKLALLGGCGSTDSSRQRRNNGLSNTLAAQQYTTFCRFFFEGRRRVFSTS